MVVLMRVAPYLRILWGILIILNITVGSFESLGPSDKLNEFSQFLIGIVKGIFALYCMLVGIQELLNRQFTNAKIFNLFGLLFEIIVFFFSLWLTTVIVTHMKKIEVWPLRSLILWQIGILALITVDIKKYLQPRSEQEEFS